MQSCTSVVHRHEQHPLSHVVRIARHAREPDVAMVLPADRYFSSFPKVGIVIPNPAQWLLPEFQDLAAGLATTLSLPDTLLHGAFVTPTGDGFLINMPTCEALPPLLRAASATTKAPLEPWPACGH